MCLIIHKPADVTFTDHWLKDFFSRNKDGFGFMHNEGGKLYIHKSLGNEARFVETFRTKYENRECLIHLRMKTHGKIDLDNCHPYEVLPASEGGDMGAIWLMHNGVLTSGYMNGDQRKSDTWHYIKNRLAPLLRRQPKALLYPEVQAYIERDIGMSNKFALMCGRGDVVILNRSSGVEWKQAWLSNTYAWSADAEGGAIKRTYQGTHQGTYQGTYQGAYNGGRVNHGWYGGGRPFSPQASQFAADFFAALRTTKYTHAYQTLQYEDMRRMYDFSAEDSELLLEEIKAGKLDEVKDPSAYIISMVRLAHSMADGETTSTTGGPAAKKTEGGASAESPPGGTSPGGEDAKPISSAPTTAEPVNIAGGDI